MPDCLTESNPDYCTILRTRKMWRYLAVVMRFNAAQDQYEIHQSWGPLAKPEAEAMARRWAKLGGLEYKP